MKKPRDRWKFMKEEEKEIFWQVKPRSGRNLGTLLPFTELRHLQRKLSRENRKKILKRKIPVLYHIRYGKANLQHKLDEKILEFAHVYWLA